MSKLQKWTTDEWLLGLKRRWGLREVGGCGYERAGVCLCVPAHTWRQPSSTLDLLLISGHTLGNPDTQLGNVIGAGLAGEDQHSKRG